MVSGIDPVNFRRVDGIYYGGGGYLIEILLREIEILCQ